MLAIFGNIGLVETVLIAVLAILVFGKRLPQVAAQAVVQMQKLRAAMSDMRREVGLDDELRTAQRSIESGLRAPPRQITARERKGEPPENAEPPAPPEGTLPTEAPRPPGERAGEPPPSSAEEEPPAEPPRR